MSGKASNLELRYIGNFSFIILNRSSLDVGVQAK